MDRFHSRPGRKGCCLACRLDHAGGRMEARDGDGTADDCWLQCWRKPSWLKASHLTCLELDQTRSCWLQLIQTALNTCSTSFLNTGFHLFKPHSCPAGYSQYSSSMLAGGTNKKPIRLAGVGMSVWLVGSRIFPAFRLEAGSARGTALLISPRIAHFPALFSSCPRIRHGTVFNGHQF